MFLLMPGVIMLFAPLMEKTKHRNFIPKITGIAKFDYATRFLIAPVFVAVIIVAFFISNKCHYAYGYSSITPPIKNDVQIAQDMINESFDSKNFVAVIVPAGDYDKEKSLLAYIVLLTIILLLLTIIDIPMPEYWVNPTLFGV